MTLPPFKKRYTQQIISLIIIIIAAVLIVANRYIPIGANQTNNFVIGIIISIIGLIYFFDAL